jgi:hypothetical protein
LDLIKVLFLKERTDFEPIEIVFTTTLPKDSIPIRLTTISSKAAKGQSLHEKVVGTDWNDDIITINPNA